MTPAPPSGRTRLIVGCGYLGSRVAKRWLAAGDRVLAVTRSRAGDLAAKGIEPIVGNVTDPESLRHPPEVDTLLWAVGFDRAEAASPRQVHVEGLARLLDRIPGAPRVILSSSTGVWGDADGGVVDEETPPRPSREAGRVLVEAESLFAAHRLGTGVALRFAGLYGPGRLPRLSDLRAGRPIAADPDSWLNLVHVDDAARVVCGVADMDSARPLYVVSDGCPVRRRDWYARLADVAGCPPPSWDTTAPRVRGADKQVRSECVWRDLGLAPLHPDSIAALREVVAD